MADLLNLQKHQVTSSLKDKIFLIYGEPGTRKTTVATGDSEKTLLVAFEIGYKFIPNIYAVPVSKWYDLKDILNSLADDTVKQKYSTIAIDTIGLAYKSCVSYICAKNQVADIGDIAYGKGYTLVRNEFEKVINTIPQLGYGLIMIAHSDELIDKESNVSVKVDIDKRPSAIIKGLADFILYTRKEPLDTNKEEMTVYAYSEVKSEKIEVKRRARFFPKRFEFTYENLKEALKEAVKLQDEFYGIQSLETLDFTAYQEKEVDLVTLQTEVIELASELFKTPLANKVDEILLNTLRGVRVSETTKAHVDLLFAVKADLLELKKGL